MMSDEELADPAKAGLERIKRDLAERTDEDVAATLADTILLEEPPETPRRYLLESVIARLRRAKGGAL